MTRPLTPEERTIVAEEMALATEVAGLRPGADTPYVARLRVRTAGGVRDVLLADRTLAGASATLVDWQTAPLAEVFLGAGVGDEYEHEVEGRTLRGTVLRRHVVGFFDGELSEILGDGVVLRRVEEGWLADDEPGPRLGATSRARSPGQVRLDAVQRAAVELDATRSLLVLGEAGFGKTTVALHRLAFLAGAARAGRRRFRALVVVPTPGLQRLATHLLAELGVTGARVVTFAGWVAAEAWRVFPALPRRLSADAGATVAKFKRDPALRSVLPRVVAGTSAMREVRRGYRDEPETIRELLLHLFGDRELLAEVVAAADGRLPGSAIAGVAAHTRVQFTPTSERALRHVDAERLRTLDGRPLDAGTPLADAATIDAEDFAVVFALHRRISGGDATRHGALSRYEHVLLDEAQELAPIELELLGRAVAPGGTVTIAGDERQQVDESTRFVGWPAVVAELGPIDPVTVSLAISYRCPPAIEAAARAVVDPTARPPGPADALLVSRYGHACHLVVALADALAALLADDPRVTVAVVCRHAEVAERLHARLTAAIPARLVVDGSFCFRPGVDVTCTHEIKGLEFDVVVIPDADARTYPDEPAARRALYVAMTRAVDRLWLMTGGPWSPVLAPMLAAREP
jgi:DNA helicase-2/ATP-dependent DNA helicase PcrA